MEPEVKTFKEVLRKIDSNNTYDYLTSVQARKSLGYVESCLGFPENPEIYNELISIDCEMLQTTIGPQICSIYIASSKGEIFHKKYTI